MYVQLLCNLSGSFSVQCPVSPSTLGMFFPLAWKTSYPAWLHLGSFLFSSFILDLVFSRMLSQSGMNYFQKYFPCHHTYTPLNWPFSLSITREDISFIKESSASRRVPSPHRPMMILVEWMDDTADNLLCVCNAKNQVPFL